MPRRWTPTDLPPEGLLHRPGFLTPAEEGQILERIRGLSFREVRMKGVAARRTTAHFGYGYGYESWRVEPVEPIPDFLLGLRARSAAAVGLAGEDFVEALVTRYPTGAGIGWHRDAMAFGDAVIGISLLSACVMKLRREDGDRRILFSLRLEPRSLYAFTGAARWRWQHSIPAAKSPRYSVTFRTLRAAAPAAAERRAQTG